MQFSLVWRLFSSVLNSKYRLYKIKCILVFQPQLEVLNSLELKNWSLTTQIIIQGRIFSPVYACIDFNFSIIDCLRPLIEDGTLLHNVSGHPVECRWCRYRENCNIIAQIFIVNVVANKVEWNHHEKVKILVLH